MSTATAPPPKSVGPFTAEALTELIAQRNEPSWLAARRREALAQFETAPWPTLRDEEWRRTDIRGLKLTNFKPPGGKKPANVGETSLAPFYEELESLYGGGLVQVDDTTAITP